MRTILIAYPQNFHTKSHLTKIQKSGSITLKMAGPALQPSPQVLVENMLMYGGKIWPKNMVD